MSNLQLVIALIDKRISEMEAHLKEVSEEKSMWVKAKASLSNPPRASRDIPIGTHVRTVQPAVPTTGWTDEAKANRRFGYTGVILKEHRGHGLCYEVMYHDPGAGGPFSGTFEPEELEVGPMPSESEAKPSLQDFPLEALTTELIRRGYVTNLSLPVGARVRTAKILNPAPPGWAKESNRGRIPNTTGVINHHFHFEQPYYVVAYNTPQEIKSGSFLLHELELLEVPKP